jgi:hypothetical protein
MHAFLNDGQSCYMDTVLVCMFVPTDGFDFMLKHPRRPVMKALNDEVDRLHREVQVAMDGQASHAAPWVLGDFRRLMGNPWNTNSSQSAVDFLHALLDTSGVMYLGTQTVSTTHIPRDPQSPEEFSVLQDDAFRIHTVMAGYHKSLSSAMSHVEHMPDGVSKYSSIVTDIEVDDPDVLVFEVGRNHSTDAMHYGSMHGDEKCTLGVGDKTYVLFGVICRKSGHYVAYLWMCGWYFYDDLKGVVVACQHPETCEITPSQFGELFFYYLQ